MRVPPHIHRHTQKIIIEKTGMCQTIKNLSKLKKVMNAQRGIAHLNVGQAELAKTIL